MKPLLKLLMLVFVASCAAFSAHAAALTVSPGLITAEFSGSLVLEISGVAPGEQVLLERFVDLNGNGAADAGEPVTLSLRLADGVVPVIGGVTNINVPHDINPAAGVITARLPFLELDRFAGKQVFRVSSPGGSFTPATAILTINSAAHGQSVAGVVRSGGVPVPYALVGLARMGHDDGLAVGAIADASGGFTIPAPAGSYELVAVKPGFVLAESEDINLGAGAALTRDVNLAAATRTISGRLFETENSAAGLAGVELFFESDEGFTFGFTDANGNFSVGVLPGEWEIEPGEMSLALLGYLMSELDATVGAEDVSGLQLELPKVAALIHGHLRGPTEAPVPGIGLYSNNNHGLNGSGGITDENGYYVVGVTHGNWSVGPFQEDLARLGLSVQGTSITITDGEAVVLDFLASAFTAYLEGQVIQPGGSPVGNIRLQAANWSAGGWSSMETDGNGNFRLGVFAGSWGLQLDSWDAAERGLIGPTLDFQVNDGVDITNITYVARSITASIAGFVRETNGNPVGSVGVYAYAMIDGETFNVYTQTDGAGNFSSGVIGGTWTVGVSDWELFSRGLAPPESQTAHVTTGGTTVTFTVSEIGPLMLATTSLPGAVVGEFYSVQLEASGGIPPYNFSFAPGSEGLPPGMFFGGTGMISGTPQFAGNSIFTFRVQDWAGSFDEQELTLTIAPSGGAPRFTSASRLPNGAFEMLLQGAPGNWYRLEASTNLVHWISLQADMSANPVDGTVYFRDDATSGVGIRYYRARVVDAP